MNDFLVENKNDKIAKVLARLLAALFFYPLILWACWNFVAKQYDLPVITYWTWVIIRVFVHTLIPSKGDER